jgi:hypothetical protein
MEGGLMSTIEVNRICYQISHDPEFLAAVRENPHRAIADRSLTAAEREALLNGDVAALYRRGAHPVLLVRLATHRVFGLDEDLYIRRIRAVGSAGQTGSGEPS